MLIRCLYFSSERTQRLRRAFAFFTTLSCGLRFAANNSLPASAIYRPQRCHCLWLASPVPGEVAWFLRPNPHFSECSSGVQSSSLSVLGPWTFKKVWLWLSGGNWERFLCFYSVMIRFNNDLNWLGRFELYIAARFIRQFVFNSNFLVQIVGLLNRDFELFQGRSDARKVVPSQRSLGI